ncbi:MAG: hypothetical protein ACE5J7_04905 [Candidatus Aenigmatarchaeota archaeon]
MAVKTEESKKEGRACPRCGQRLLTIDGSFIRWLTCPHCKFKKLEEKEKEKKIRITPMMDGHK